jgi:HSP20 family protein
MTNERNPQSSSQDVQSQGTSQSSQSVSPARPAAGSLQRHSFDPFMISPWEFFSSNPFSVMRRMSEEMDDFFNEARGGTRRSSRGSWAPAIDVAERDGKYVVHADLPGLKPEEVKVQLRDNALIIEGERRSQHEENQGGIHRSERRYGQFYRAIPLPEGVNPDQVNAHFENGVLEITAPMPQTRQNSRQIPIQSGTAQSSGQIRTGESTQSKGAQPEGTQSGSAGRNRAA